MSRASVELAPGLVPEPGTPLYVHVPFCVAKCTYCDFYSVAAEGQDLLGTMDALLAEAERRAPSRPRTVYLGGGTPSYYAIDELARLLDGLQRWTRFRESAEEVTCECNPESLDLEKARALRALGVDRLSIGFQSLDPGVLELFGRVHDAEQSFRAFRAARAAGFERLSVDLIYGVPGQSLEAWLEDLKKVLELRPDHVSAYQLTYEPGTALGTREEEGTLQRLDEEAELAFFQAIRGALTEAGLEPYEVSNFSLSGQRCLHNVNYWQNGSYVGLGPSAVSRVGPARFGNPRSLGPWRAAIAGGRFPAAWEESLEPAGRLGETWWLGLRLKEGVDPEEARRRAGFGAGAAGLAGDPAEAEAARLLALGFLERGAGRYRLTARGWPVADAIARRILGACRSGAPTPPWA